MKSQFDEWIQNGVVKDKKVREVYMLKIKNLEGVISIFHPNWQQMQ